MRRRSFRIIISACYARAAFSAFGAAQLVWGDGLPSDDGFRLESGFHREALPAFDTGELKHEGHGAHGHLRHTSGRGRQGAPRRLQR